jgi:transcriptional regulator with XRE-family HTH domain
MDIDVERLNFDDIAERLKAYRIVHGLSKSELAKRCGVKVATIARIEGGQQYSTMNHYWSIVRAEQFSAPWFFYGDGKWNDKSVEYMPATVVYQRGAGVRRSEERYASESGQYEGDPFEFVLAVEEFKRQNSKQFPSWTEIFELMINLGYRRVEEPAIQPYNALRNNNDSSKSKRHSNGRLRKTALMGN